ncbi:hypothetical protein D3C81_1971750 [compost metagenome]
MRIAFVLFDGITFLDFAGFYDVITGWGNLKQGKGCSGIYAALGKKWQMSSG